MKQDKAPSSDKPDPSRSTDMASPMEDWKDRELVAEYQRTSDERIFEILCRRLREPMFRAAFGITKDAHSAEDVCQEAFVRLWKRLPTLSLTSQLVTFLYPMVERLAWRAVRKRSERVPENARQEIESSADQVPVDGRAEIEAVDRAIEDLPPKLREVVRLHWFEGLKLREIAKMKNVPLGTVYRQHQRASQRLKRLLITPALIDEVAADLSFLKKD